MKDQFVQWLNRLLVFNVFFVIGGFVWLIIAAIGKSLNIPLGLDLFYQLWQPLFNPALGILMAGALLSWAINQISGRFAPK